MGESGDDARDECAYGQNGMGRESRLRHVKDKDKQIILHVIFDRICPHTKYNKTPGALRIAGATATWRLACRRASHEHYQQESVVHKTQLFLLYHVTD
jgi:hypothetical protein